MILFQKQKNKLTKKYKIKCLGKMFNYLKNNVKLNM